MYASINKAKETMIKARHNNICTDDSITPINKPIMSWNTPRMGILRVNCIMITTSQMTIIENSNIMFGVVIPNWPIPILTTE
jgi:hypothetical protein